MARIIQVDYDVLQTSAVEFGRQADQVRRLVAFIRQGMDGLQSGGWQGMAAGAFFSEMEGDIFPALNRLIAALDASKTHTLLARERFRTGEEQAARYFTREDSDVLPLERLQVPGGRYTGLPGGSAFTDYAGGLIELAKKIFPNLPYKDIAGPVIGTLLDAWTNPDQDWGTSIGSAVFQNIIKLEPHVAVASGVSSIIQLFGRVDSALAAWNNDLISPTPAIHSSLDVISGRIFGYDDNVPNSGNLERLNLDNVLEPLGDIVYHAYITPIREVVEDAWSNPSLQSIGRLGQVALNVGSPLAPVVNLLGSPSAQAGVITGARDLISGAGNVLYGAVDLQASLVDYNLASGAANLIRSTDSWPIPTSWERTIDSSAEWFISRIEYGMIPGVNIPMIPVF
jgi:WXG100 family type VII secretion target